MKIGFALITENPFFSNIVHLENEVHDVCNFRTVLGMRSNIPHTTLFQGSFRNDVNYGLILSSIQDYVVNYCDDLTLDFEKVVYAPDGWYFYECAKTKSLQALHNFVLGVCEPFIELDPLRMYRDLSMCSDEEREAIQQYGYRYAGKGFHPHVMIGKTFEECDQGTLDLLNEKVTRFGRRASIQEITVYRMGVNGAHQETLAAVKFE